MSNENEREDPNPRAGPEHGSSACREWIREQRQREREVAAGNRVTSDEIQRFADELKNGRAKR